VKEDKILLRINRSMTTLNSATRGLNSRQKNIEARMRRVSQSITVYLIWEEKTKESSITLVYSGRTYLSQISSVILHDLAFPREQPLYYQCWLTEKDLDGSVDACHAAIWYCCFHAFANADLVIRSTCVLFFFSPLVLLDLFDALGCHLSGLAVPAISSISCCLLVMPNLPPVTAGIQTILVLVSWATAAGLAPGQMALALSLAEFCCLLLWTELLAGGICWFSFWLLLSNAV